MEIAVKQPLLIITGIPRSATTRMAAYCQMMGQPLEGTWIPEIWAGGLEDDEVKRINKTILEVGQSAEVAAAIRDFPRPIFKEPRFVTLEQPALVEAWFAHRPELRFLVMRRDFLQAGFSMHNSRRIKPIGRDPEEAAEIFGRQYGLFMDTVRRLNVPYVELEHPYFIRDFNGARSALEDFGGLRLVPNEEVIQRYGKTPGTPEEVWRQWFDEGEVRRH